MRIDDASATRRSDRRRPDLPARNNDPDKMRYAEVITVNEFNEYVRERFSTAGDIMIIGWRNQSSIRLISLPNDKFGSE